MLKAKIKKIINRLLILLLFSLILYGIGILAGGLIANNTNKKMYDILTYEGVLLIVIGIFMSMKGSPSGTNFNGIGSENAQGISYLNLEATRLERETKPYHKEYFKNNILHFSFYNIVFILSGLLLIATCLILI